MAHVQPSERNESYRSENKSAHNERKDAAAFKTGVENGSIVITDANYADYFKHEVVALDTKNLINYLDKYYFYGIPKTNIDKNPNLEQTKDWDGGTFDPLQ